MLLLRYPFSLTLLSFTSPLHFLFSLTPLHFNEALQKDPSGNFLALRKIEAAKEIAQHISEGNNRIILDADVLLFNKLTQPADIPPPRATSKKW